MYLRAIVQGLYSNGMMQLHNNRSIMIPREAELRSPLSNEYQASVVCNVRRKDDLDKARKKRKGIILYLHLHLQSIE